MKDDEYYMREAIKEAKTALHQGNWPIGCVIVLDGEIISRGHNKVYSDTNRLGHAEMDALGKAQKILSKNRMKATLYTTVEPCMMCFGGLTFSRIKRVVFGTDIDGFGVTNISDLPEVYNSDSFKCEIASGVLEEECSEVFMKSPHAQELMKEKHA